MSLDASNGAQVVPITEAKAKVKAPALRPSVSCTRNTSRSSRRRG
jgi:hypothetical protein